MSSNHQEGRPPVHENSFKIMVAREYLSSKLGYGKLGDKYNLSIATVRHFVRWYKQKYPSGQDTELSTTGTVQQPLAISTEVEELRKQLQQSNLKAAAYELLLENARKELGIDIVKKFGTKQSGK